MNSLRRLKASLSASFGSIVNEVENQEGIIDAAIKDVLNALGKMNIQIRQVEREIINTKNKEKSLKKDIVIWQERAKSVHDTDKELAKNCIKKIITMKSEKERCEEIIKNKNELLKKLRNEQGQIQNKMLEIERRKHELLGRQNNIKATEVYQSVDGNSSLDDIFNRWENKLVMKETHLSSYEPFDIDDRDEIEKHFDQEDEDKQVDKELESLLQNKN